MKQIIQSYRTGDLKLSEVSVPALGPGHVLVQTAFSAVSLGTEARKVTTARQSLVAKARSRPDLVQQVIRTARSEGIAATYRKVMNRLDEPVPLGYSAAGRVIAIGANVERYRVGDRVACAGEGAAHAEVIAVPVNLCAKVPDEVGLEHAALTTIGAIALQGLRQANVTLGERVAVIGLGLVGQLALQLLKAAGCLVLGIDLDQARVALADKLGADRALERKDPNLDAAVLAFSEGYGVDAVLVMAATPSNDPVELAVQMCRDRGRIVVVGAVGLSLPRDVCYHKELEVRLSRSYGPGRYEPTYEQKGIDYPIGYVRWTEQRNMQAFLDLLATGRITVEPLITHRFKFDEAPKAYDLLTGKHRNAPASLGILFEYDTGKDHLTRAVLSVHIPHSSDTRLGDTNLRSPPSTIGVGFIGAGSFARKVLIPSLAKHPHVRLVGVATATGISGLRTAEKFDFAYSTGDYHQILDDQDIHVVFITTRHNLHGGLAAEALRQGKAVFVEKPLALSWEELREVVVAQRETGGYVTVGFNRRFAALTQEVCSFLEGHDQPLVVHYRVNAGFVQAKHWVHDSEEGGGRILGEVCHFVDLITHLVGVPVRTVYAVGMDNAGRYHNDNVSIALAYADGSVGNILYLANGDVALAKERIEVFCQEATAVIDDFRRLEVYRNARRTVRRGPHDKGHRAEVEAVVETIRSGSQSPVPFGEAVLSTLVTFKVLESLRTGQPMLVTESEFLDLGLHESSPTKDNP